MQRQKAHNDAQIESGPNRFTSENGEACRVQRPDKKDPHEKRIGDKQVTVDAETARPIMRKNEGRGLTAPFPGESHVA